MFGQVEMWVWKFMAKEFFIISPIISSSECSYEKKPCENGSVKKKYSKNFSIHRLSPESGAEHSLISRTRPRATGQDQKIKIGGYSKKSRFFNVFDKKWLPELKYAEFTVILMILKNFSGVLVNFGKSWQILILKVL
jgi:hypothetical protein